MRKIYNYIMLAVMAFASVGCVEDLIDPNTPSVGSGDDVQFGLSLNDSETRTIYGAEDNKAFPIYWSQGDRVLVASPQCPDGRNSAEYGVTPVSGQSYAEAMNKTGEFGVQWGSSERADFYSIYPSTNASWQTLSETNVTAKLNIAPSQSADHVLNNGVYNSADMNNVIMYARTADVENGKTVNLKYKPYSTILEFEMTIAPTGTNQTYGSAKVMSMTLTAPEGTPISGDFTLTFNGNNTPVVSAIGNNSNTISLVFASQPVLNEDNKTLKAKLALIPDAATKNINGWVVEIDVREGSATETKPYKLTLNTEATLTPGKIHKIKLPAFTPEAAWVYQKESWITSLYDYKNIYLTELSIPGAWYSLGKKDGGYQASNHDATKLWNAGVRAFAVECRSYTKRKTINIGNNTDAPTRIAVSGLGSNQGGAYTHQTLQSSAMIYISDVISDIAGAINKNEFGVLVLSYADGGSGGHRDIDYKYFLEGIAKEITQSGASNIYSSEITPETTVEDVLGTLIIKVNVDNNLPKGNYTYTKAEDGKISGGMNVLLSYNPFMKQLASSSYTTPLFSKMYWSEWDDEYKTTTTNNDSDFLWCFSSANRTATDGSTTDVPTYAQRKTALRSMIEHSKEITANSGHNVWFYFNAGGTAAPNASDDTDAADAQEYAKIMNSWLLDIIKLKANGGIDTKGVFGVEGAYLKSDASPLGIVMFNQCTGDNATYHGEDIIKEIIEMNNKANLLRATTTIVPDIPNEPVPDEEDEV